MKMKLIVNKNKSEYKLKICTQTRVWENNLFSNTYKQ